MGPEHEEHAHEHQVVEIIDTDTITAYAQSPHGIITGWLHQRGPSLDLNFGEAIALATVMEKVVEHVNANPKE